MHSIRITRTDSFSATFQESQECCHFLYLSKPMSLLRFEGFYASKWFEPLFWKVWLRLTWRSSIVRNIVKNGQNGRIRRKRCGRYPSGHCDKQYVTDPPLPSSPFASERTSLIRNEETWGLSWGRIWLVMGLSPLMSKTTIGGSVGTVSCNAAYSPIVGYLDEGWETDSFAFDKSQSQWLTRKRKVSQVWSLPDFRASTNMRIQIVQHQPRSRWKRRSVTFRFAGTLYSPILERISVQIKEASHCATNLRPLDQVWQFWRWNA